MSKETRTLGLCAEEGDMASGAVVSAFRLAWEGFKVWYVQAGGHEYGPWERRPRHEGGSWWRDNWPPPISREADIVYRVGLALAGLSWTDWVRPELRTPVAEREGKGAPQFDLALVHPANARRGTPQCRYLRPRVLAEFKFIQYTCDEKERRRKIQGSADDPGIPGDCCRLQLQKNLSACPLDGFMCVIDDDNAAPCDYEERLKDMYPDVDVLTLRRPDGEAAGRKPVRIDPGRWPQPGRCSPRDL
jgi:hypothetical protein